MAKSPIAHRVKTRLVQNGVSPEDAARLAYAFLQDTYHLARRVLPPADLWLALDGEAEALPAEWLNVFRFTQQGADLGARITHVFQTAFTAGYTSVCVVGSDAPHLPSAFVSEAFGRLANGADAVFTPADDGGYCLVALREMHPVLFQSIAWSTSSVWTETLRNAVQAGLRVETTPAWYDVDTIQDVTRLHTDLNRAVLFAPATHAAIQAWERSTTAGVSKPATDSEKPGAAYSRR